MRDKQGVACLNRRYFGEDLFNRLLLIASTYRTDFEHRTYRKAA
ncbi:hypothetical protein [Prevotella sp.]